MLNSLIPNRSSNAMTGFEFIKNNINVNRKTLENNILSEFFSGNIPDFLRQFKEINVSDNNNKITYLTTNDYLSIGSENDYVRIPMSPLVAQQIANKFDCSLPTRKIVDDIWKQSDIKLIPKPWGPPYDQTMMNVDRFLIHNNTIQSQLLNKDYKSLISGHKKDVVLSNTIAPNNPKERVVIYGWINPNGTPIQNLNYWSHESFYYDYSHGIRLITNDVMVNGNPMRLQDVFKDPTLCKLVSDEGILEFISY